MWISPSNIKNYCMNDPAQDWYDFHANTIDSKYSPVSIIKNIPKSSSQKNKNSSTNLLFSQGEDFEKKIVEKLSLLYDVVSINANVATRDFADLTIHEMKNGRAIIHGGVLIDDETQIYGIPDLIIRSDYVKQIIQNEKDNRNIWCSSQKNDPPSFEVTNNGCSFNDSYHYIIFEIKHTCIPLTASGESILNSDLFPFYKCQVYMYNQIVGKIQGYIPKNSYIMGRSCERTKSGHRYFCDIPFLSIGVVDYEKKDCKTSEKVKNAIAWRREVASDVARNWNAVKYPLDREELYPNAKCTYDTKWWKVKNDIIDQNNEITSVYRVGVNNRNLALKSGIYCWNDEQCTSKILGINGLVNSNQVDCILNTNRNDEIISPSEIEHNLWTDDSNDYIEFFVDFETFNGCFSNIKSVDVSNNDNYIYMIGVGYDDTIDKWTSKTFISKELTDESEEYMCYKFAKYINSICKLYNKKARLFHWSNAEYTWWVKVCSKYNILLNLSSQFEWVDLLKIFTTQPICIKGSLNFKLKHIAGAMYKNQMITSTWKKGDVSDGISAMLAAKIIYEKNINIKNEMKSIVKYNKTDVIVLYEILQYLREYYLNIPNTNSAKRKGDYIENLKHKSICNDPPKTFLERIGEIFSLL